MTARIVDTAQLPLTRPPSAVPPVSPVPPVSDAPVSPALASAPVARHVMRSERRSERRRRLAYAVGGIAVLTAFLLATVAVLGVVR